MADENGWKDGLTRRRLVGGAVGLAAVGGAGFGALTFGTSEATAQTSGVTASDVSIDSNDGTVTELTIDPDLDVTWSNFETDVSEARAEFFASLDSSSPQSSFASTRATSSNTGATGSMTIRPGQLSLLQSSGGPIDATDLEDTTEGDGPKETDIMVAVRIVFIDSAGNDISSPVPNDSAVFTVSVDNLTSTASLSGPLNTGGS